MRRTASYLFVVAVMPAMAVVLPVVSTPTPRPHPVTPTVHALTVHPVVGVAARSTGAGRTLAALGSTSTAGFQLVGARWDAGTLSPYARVQVRTHDRQGWSAWTDLDPLDTGADRGRRDSRAADRRVGAVQTAEPVWVGAADGVQARVVTAPGAPAGVRPPRHLAVSLVDGGRSAADAHPGPPRPIGGAVAAAAVDQPTIYTRAQWGADESLRKQACPDGPDYGSTIKVGFLHHTDTSNSYGPSDVPAIIRSIYAYHVESNGWCDVGYNFLIDKFGRIWEGRWGGIDKPVIGAHTGGFNTDSFGASIIGTFSSVTPPTAAQDAVAKLWAWKLGTYYRDPLGTETLHAGSFSESRYPSGSEVTFRTLSGHRDADVTSCPGNAAYALLPSLRQRIAQVMGAGLVDPTDVSTQVRYDDGKSLEVKAGVLADQTWTLTVTDSAGNVVRTLSGTASRSAPVDAVWDAKDAAGVPAVPGTYTLRLDSAAGSATAVPYTTTVKVLSPVQLTGPSTSDLGAQVTLTGVAPAGSQLTFYLHKRNVPGWSPAGQATAGPDGAFTFGFVADDDYRWMASTGEFQSEVGLTQVAPTVTGPAQLPSPPVAVSGTAVPDGTVTIYASQGGVPAASAGTVTAGANGAWSATLTPTGTVTYYARDSRGLTSPKVTTTLPTAPTASGPARVAYGDQVTLQGTANPGDGVQVWVHKRGPGGYALAATVAAGANGAWSWSYRADDDYRWYAVNSAGRSPLGLTQVVPTISGPRTVARNSLVTLSGTAVPGAAVIVYFHRRYTTGYTIAKGTRANAQGAYSVSFVCTEDHRWFAASLGKASLPGLTQVR